METRCKWRKPRQQESAMVQEISINMAAAVTIPNWNWSKRVQQKWNKNKGSSSHNTVLNQLNWKVMIIELILQCNKVPFVTGLNQIETKMQITKNAFV